MKHEALGIFQVRLSTNISGRTATGRSVYEHGYRGMDIGGH